MATFFSTQLDFILFFYGLAFLLLGTTCFGISRAGKEENPGVCSDCGFHHHATLCIAAYGFLITERVTIPPSGPRSATLFQSPRLPDDYRPRGSTIAA